MTPNKSQAITFGKHGGLFFNNGSRTYVAWDIHSLRCCILNYLRLYYCSGTKDSQNNQMEHNDTLS